MRTYLAGPWEMVMKVEGFAGPASEQLEQRIKKMVKDRYAQIKGKFNALNDILKNLSELSKCLLFRGTSLTEPQIE